MVPPQYPEFKFISPIGQEGREEGGCGDLSKFRFIIDILQICRNVSTSKLRSRFTPKLAFYRPHLGAKPAMLLCEKCADFRQSAHVLLPAEMLYAVIVKLLKVDSRVRERRRSNG